MDSEFWSSDTMRDFTWVVDSAIRSDTASSLGASPICSFASVVDSAIRSETASNLGEYSYASAVSNRTRHVAARVFTRAELKKATKNFSVENKIGAGNFAVVYRGKLPGGREVAIKRGESIWFNLCAFKSELAFLSRLHHRNLVGLVGFCKEKYDRLLVYEYMKNGSLYYHLHDKNNVDKRSSLLNYWKMRIKIALDASRGIDHLHNCAVPSIIHRRIKSSNILIDGTWTAKVSDFRLSFMSPDQPDPDYPSKDIRGSFGYSDPEYFRLNVVTTKSDDVYGFGVVLLELLTGKTEVFKSREDIGTPLVYFAVPAILAGELVKILDPRIRPPDVNEVVALELVAKTAILCVSLKEKDRPTMVDIALILEQALDICDSISYDILSSRNVSMIYLENQ